MKTIKHALVTGGAKRIGAAITKGLALDGWTVGIHCHTSVDEAHALSKDLVKQGARTYTLEADLTDQTRLDNLISEAIKVAGPLTCLINNASVFEPDDVNSFSRRSWNLHLDINLWAPTRLSQSFATNFPSEQLGNIINIADQRVMGVPPDFLSYTISKSALWTMTQSLAITLAPSIRVNAIGPGPTLPSPRQNIEDFRQQASHMPLGTGASPEEIGLGVRYILSTPSLTGQLITLDGGQHLGWDFPDEDSPVLE